VVKPRGIFQATLDEKGRVSIPARLREGVPHNVLVLTKSMYENCIWAFTPENMEKETEKRMKSSDVNGDIPMTPRQEDMFSHRVGFFTSDVDMDKTGRIMIPQTFRDFAGLIRDCIITSDGVRIEIWDAGRFAEYEQRVEEFVIKRFAI